MNACYSLHIKNILHRDLKPSNILLHQGQIKIADFGFCKLLRRRQDVTRTMVGSPIYMAPEILKGRAYNIQCDIWSMGVLFYELLFARCPFEERSIPRLIQRIDTSPVTFPRHFNNISVKTEQLLKKMLVPDPRRRITWEELFRIFSITKYTAEHGIDGTGDRHEKKTTPDTSLLPSKTSSNTTADHYKKNYYKQPQRPSVKPLYPARSVKRIATFPMVQLNSLEGSKPLVNKPVNIPIDTKMFKKPISVNESRQYLEILIRKRQSYQRIYKMVCKTMEKNLSSYSPILCLVLIRKALQEASDLAKKI